MLLYIHNATNEAVRLRKSVHVLTSFSFLDSYDTASSASLDGWEMNQQQIRK